MEVVGFLLGALFFIILEGIFAGSEIALVSTDKSKVLSLYRKTNYSFLKDFHDSPEDYVTLTMLGYTLSIVFASTFYTLAIITLSEYLPLIKGYEVLFSLSLVVFTLTFGELLPKSLFQKHADKLIIPSLWFLKHLKVIASPILYATRKLSLTVRSIIAKSYKESLSKEDILKLLNDMETKDERVSIATRLLKLKETSLSEIVQPLYEVVMIDEGSTVDRALRRMRESGFTKLPVYRNRVDDLIGYVDMFDIIQSPKERPIKEFIKPLCILPEFTTLQDVLNTFKERSSKMCAVVDERGITLGIVTLDDVIKEVLGQISDSLEKEEEPIKEIEKDKWVVMASLDKEEFEKVVGIKLPEGPFLSVGGFVIYHLRRIPKKGEEVLCCGLRFVVLQSDEKRVKKLMVERANHGLL